MSERHIHLPPESLGQAPGRGRLAGRRILVVGGGQTDIGEDDTPAGNGRAMSILFAREGAKVVVADRVLKTAEATLALMPAGQGTAIAADVSDPDAIERMVADAVAVLGGLDGLALNVGIGVRLAVKGENHGARVAHDADRPGVAALDRGLEVLERRRNAASQLHVAVAADRHERRPAADRERAGPRNDRSSPRCASVRRRCAPWTIGPAPRGATSPRRETRSPRKLGMMQNVQRLLQPSEILR